MDNFCKLGWLASELLLQEQSFLQNTAPENISIVLLNANASLDTDIKYLETVSEIASPALFVYTLPNILIGEISIRNSFKGENACFIFDKFNAEFLKKYVDELLEDKRTEYCICGWVDVLKEHYKASLFLIGVNENGITFSEENLNKIFNEGKI